MENEATYRAVHGSPKTEAASDLSASAGSAYFDAQVFQFQEELTRSIWMDAGKVCINGIGELEKELIQEVKDGKIIGYRFLTIHKEQIGVPSQNEKGDT